MEPERYALWMKGNYGYYEFVRYVYTRALAMDQCRGLVEEYRTDAKATCDEGDFKFVFQIYYRGKRV